jgi:phospholipid/cholesterol/gamma-HCH transport system ATP-binding protein
MHIELESVSFRYGAKKILDAISLSITPGTMVAIIGGSGCGKSTLLRVINGQLQPSAGRVLVDQQCLAEMPKDAVLSLRKKMGVLFQQGALFTDLNVFENVAFALREHTHIPASCLRDLVLMKLHAVGLRGAAALQPAELSGGMARRVAMARASALDPPVMLYDEPFAGLDPISLGQIGRWLRHYHRVFNATSLVVTHDINAALPLMDYVYLMAQGQWVAQGTPAQLRAYPTAYSKQFLLGEADGPVPFHYPAADYQQQLLSHQGGYSSPLN